MVKIPKICVLTGFGINCDNETAHAFNLAGGESEKVHINDLINGKKSLLEFHILAFPGGFSYGDDIASGKVFASKFKTHLWGDLKKFIDFGKLIIGICNGFQILVKMGLLPDSNGVQTVTLSHNDSGKFEDRWVNLSINKKSVCVFTKGLDKLYLPVRHGEGKFITLDLTVLKNLEKNNQIVLSYSDIKGNLAKNYPENPNGSVNCIAGICDASGRIFGLMPHPEAFIHPTNHPRWTRQKSLLKEGEGLIIFKNAINYAKTKLK